MQGVALNFAVDHEDSDGNNLLVYAVHPMLLEKNRITKFISICKFKKVNSIVDNTINASSSHSMNVVIAFLLLNFIKQMNQYFLLKRRLKLFELIN